PGPPRGAEGARRAPRRPPLGRPLPDLAHGRPMSRPPHPARPLLFLDYDGTLAPIVADPAAAVPHAAVPGLLPRLHARHPPRPAPPAHAPPPVVLVTGRHLADVAALFEDVPPIRAVGLHGTQTGTLGGDLRHLLSEDAERALARLRTRVPKGDGVVVEDKGAAFAVHYRHASDEAAALARLRAWAADVPAVLTPIWGKKVVELRPAATSKGTAVRTIAAEHPGRTPVYLGDDVTDEDAFEALAAVEGAVSVKVGEGATRARYR